MLGSRNRNAPKKVSTWDGRTKIDEKRDGLKVSNGEEIRRLKRSQRNWANWGPREGGSDGQRGNRGADRQFEEALRDSGGGDGADREKAVPKARIARKIIRRRAEYQISTNLPLAFLQDSCKPVSSSPRVAHCIAERAFNFMKERYQRQGHGEALLRAAIQKCRTRNIQRVRLHVDPSRAAALSLYLKLGFQIDELIERYYSSDRNAYRMYLDFNDN
ncbi:hypothetical protein Syun_027393 [Stephania yunnanensis]|uniref:N-acetyltransferase domain-containing protein n=1 Tax=Stephania yunnanensis TaxID=152371 RepID=A0AAP0EIV8_9MAGN